MQEAIKQLLSLQERDVELDKLSAELATIPKEIAAIKKQMADEKAALEESKKELTHATSMRKEKETALQQKEDLIRKHAGELNSIKSNDAYRAMMGEIEKGKQERSVLEDEILQWMEKADQAQKVWKERETTAKSVEGQRQSRIGEWETQAKNLEALIAQKKQEREAAAGGFPKPLVEKYDRLRGAKKGAVVVQIKNGQCAGCHMALSQNVMNEVKRGQNMMVCENCSRIVYFPEEVKTAN